MKRTDIRKIVVLGLLIAIQVILSRFLSINAWNVKIGLGFVPIVIAAILYGPLLAGITYALSDILGAILFPIGPYFPGFTVTALMSGILFGLLLHKTQSFGRILSTVLINQLVLGLVVNTFWISLLNGVPFSGLVVTRIVQCIIMLVVEFSVITLLLQSLNKLGKEQLV